MDNPITNSQGIPFTLIPVTPPLLPDTLAGEQNKQELERLYIEYGQLYHLVHGLCPRKADLKQLNLFWNRHGPLTKARKHTKWTSEQVPRDTLCRLRVKIRQLGGEPALVENRTQAATPMPDPIYALLDPTLTSMNYAARASGRTSLPDISSAQLATETAPMDLVAFDTDLMSIHNTVIPGSISDLFAEPTENDIGAMDQQFQGHFSLDPSSINQ